MAPRGVYRDLTKTKVRRVVDLGCGVGLTTAALCELFPGAEVYGTNLLDTTQAAVAKGFGRQYKFKVVEDLNKIKAPVDLIFASEYFEHVLAPVDHLHEVLDRLVPRALLIANTFTQMAVGHFYQYRIDGLPVPGFEASKIFNKTLRERGYTKVSTKMWNQRPSYWVRGK
jgi:trans-aconitate methyltransferase